jgi:DNA-binding NarL/FixJ family response regulator
VVRRTNSQPTSRELLIVDDHTLFRHGLRRLLEDGNRFIVVAEAANGCEAIRQIEIHRPGMVLLDVQLPGITGLNIARIVREKFPNVKVVVLTMYIDDERLFLALQAGVHGFLTKNIGTDELLSALERVAGGERIIDDLVLERPDFAVPILTGIRNGACAARDGSQSVPRSLRFPLSTRETEVLDYAAQGLSNREIGELLCISEQTVKNHMSSVLRKLSVDDRLQAVVRALRHGWIDIGSSDYVAAD